MAGGQTTCAVGMGVEMGSYSDPLRGKHNLFLEGQENDT